MIAIDVSNEQVFDSDPKIIQQTNFIRNPDSDARATVIFILEKSKGTISEFSSDSLKVISFRVNVI